MANKQTRSLRAVNRSTKVNKGVNLYGTSKEGARAVESGALTFQEFDSSKGRIVNSSKERENSLTPGGKNRKPWKGCGDPLGRNK